MKTRKVLFAALTATAIVLIGCASTGTKAAIKTAGNLHFDTRPHNPLEGRSMLIGKPGVFIQQIDGSRWPWNQRFISPGFHTLQVRYAAGNQNQSTTSGGVMLSYTFETGKVYIVNYEIEWADRRQGNIRFFIEETNDTSSLAASSKDYADYITAIEGIERDREAVRQYLAFSEANPAYIQGTWTYSRSYPPEDMEITFGSNNRFATIGFNRLSKRTVTTEGIFFFNQDSIVLYYGKVNENDSFEKEIIYYELKDGILHIIEWTFGINGSVAITTAGSMKGEYRKK